MTHLSVDQAMQLAVAHHRAGRFAPSQTICQQILAANPNHADALHLLGILAGQSGRLELAIDLLRRAVAASPGNAIYLNNLGAHLQRRHNIDMAIDCFQQSIALNPNSDAAHRNLADAWRDKGDLHQAVAGYQKAIALNPQFHAAHNNLGVTLYRLGHIDAAIASLQRAVVIKPDYVEAHINLGNAYKDNGDLEQASRSYRHALTLNPNSAQAHSNLGVVLKEKGELDLALACHRKALAINPDLPEIHINLGVALTAAGQFDQAVAALQCALILDPHNVDALTNLGVTWESAGQPDRAIACHERALALNSNHARTHNNLGTALLNHHRPQEALASLQRAVAIDPHLSQAHNNLASAWKDIGHLDHAVAGYRRAIDINPTDAAAHDNLLYALLAAPDQTPASQYAESQRWNDRHAAPLSRFIQPHANDRDPHRRLRVGYVSPDFRSHPVGRFILPLLASHDRTMFDITAYSQVKVPDETTTQLQSHTDLWRSTIGLSDAQLAQLIVADKIDLLVDLAGHTANNRLLVFARKPAPVQITYLGYPNTTGLATIDYRLTDHLADPPGSSDSLHSEQLCRLPTTAWCFGEPPHSVAVSESPAMSNGCVTFGSFNNLAKVNEPLLRTWSQILHSTPRSRLVLKAMGLASSDAQQMVRRVMASAGIDQARIDIHPWASAADHLVYYNQIDIALDTYPYHGTTTTCEALWMGVPVVTCAGPSHVSRVGVSLLSNVGLPELIAKNPDKYVSIATTLAADLPRLADWRNQLRPRLQSSPLMDAPRFARDIQAAYRSMWQTWCASGR
jgi:predicted O-linked N-acetylglucosamine transferase (SPINDLY family)